MWELDHKESWDPKNWSFWTVVLEKTLQSSLDSKEIKPVNPEVNKPWLFFFLPLYFFKLKGNFFTEFCAFLSHMNKNQPQAHPCPLPPSSLPTPPSGLQQSPRFSSLSHTSNSHCLSGPYLVLWISMLLPLYIPSSPSSPPTVSVGLFSMSVSPLLPWK